MATLSEIAAWVADGVVLTKSRLRQMLQEATGDTVIQTFHAATTEAGARSAIGAAAAAAATISDTLTVTRSDGSTAQITLSNTNGAAGLAEFLLLDQRGTADLRRWVVRNDAGVLRIGQLDDAGTTFTERARVTTAGVWDFLSMPIFNGGAALGIDLRAVVATTSGTSVDVSTTIPAGAKRVTLQFQGLGTSGTSVPIVQIGAASFETTGYLGAASLMTSTVASANYTTGLGLSSSWASTHRLNGVVRCDLLDAATNLWQIDATCGRTDAAGTTQASAAKTLTGALQRLRLTTVGGSDTFTAGSCSISVEG